MNESELILLVCDGDDDLTQEQYEQAFCLESPAPQLVWIKGKTANIYVKT